MKEVGQAVMFAASLYRRRAAVAYNGYVRRDPMARVGPPGRRETRLSEPDHAGAGVDQQARLSRRSPGRPFLPQPCSAGLHRTP
jgi:hypothetical protein